MYDKQTELRIRPAKRRNNLLCAIGNSLEPLSGQVGLALTSYAVETGYNPQV